MTHSKWFNILKMNASGSISLKSLDFKRESRDYVLYKNIVIKSIYVMRLLKGYAYFM